jgi:hypothetical protein
MNHQDNPGNIYHKDRGEPGKKLFERSEFFFPVQRQTVGWTSSRGASRRLAGFSLPNFLFGGTKRKFDTSLSGSECSHRRTKESCMLMIMPRVLPEDEIAP